MIVDSVEEVHGLLRCIENRKTLIVPILASPAVHVSCNPLVALYVYTEDDVERIVPIRHTEQVQGFPELVSAFMQLENIFVHDK
jgi:hypothetical protein